MISSRRRTIDLCLLLVLFAAVPLGCGKSKPAANTPPPPVVTVARPVMYPVQTYYQYNGYLDSVDAVQVRAQVRGILNKVHFVEGDYIKAGTLLYTIDPREYQAGVARAEAEIEKAEADTINADAQIKLAEADLARQQRAAASVSATELDKAIAAVAANRALKKIAQANRNAALAALSTAKLDLERTRITAEIGGRVGRTLVTQGNLVGQNETTLLTTIVRMDKLYVYFDAPERDLVEHLRAARKVTPAPIVPLELGVATEPGFPHPGSIDFRENRVDPGTGTIRVRGLLDNPVGPDGKQRQLYPGLFARVRVPSEPARARLVIPEDAIMTGQEGTYVYILGEGNVVSKRTVKLVPGPPLWRSPPDKQDAKDAWHLTNPTPPEGTPAETRLRSVVAIEQGLEPTDVLIVSGLQRARPGTPVTPEMWTVRPPAPPELLPVLPR